jgi:hypothetical protein
MAKARRKVSQLSGSNSGGSSHQSLRLRSGRIWSKGARGSRLGSMLEMVEEPPDSPQEEHHAPRPKNDEVFHHHQPVSTIQDFIPLPENQSAAVSLPHLERLRRDDEELDEENDDFTEVKSLKRPVSSGK